MNQSNLAQIFHHYIENFALINNREHNENYKWEIAYRFRPMMDAALSVSDDEFPSALNEVKKLTKNLIDSYTQPFSGLCRFAERYPERVRQMFKALFAEDSGDVNEKNQKILAFLESSHALRDELYPDSYLYKDDYHSVSAYLFLYDPDHNYLYKASHALAFADCIEFYDDWGSGTNVRLNVFYRMCDAVVSAVNDCESLCLTDKSRFEGKDGLPRTDLFADENKHILLFDIMYCCSTYNLFHGISYNCPNSKERRLMQELREKARECRAKLDDARRDMQKLTDATAYLQSCFQPGTKVRHRTFKEGAVIEIDGDLVTIEFAAGTKKMGLNSTVSGGFITTGRLEADGRLEECLLLLKRESLINTSLRIAEKEFAKYAEYLD